MSKLNIALLSLSAMLFLFIFLDSKLSQKKNINSSIIEVTTLTNFAYSNSIYEKRFKEYEVYSKNNIYSNIQTSYLDFVYEK